MFLNICVSSTVHLFHIYIPVKRKYLSKECLINELFSISFLDYASNVNTSTRHAQGGGGCGAGCVAVLEMICKGMAHMTSLHLVNKY